MSDIVAVCAILGAIIELIAAVGGPQLAGVGRLTNEPAPAMETVPLLVGIGTAAVSAAGGVLVSAGRNGPRWGIALLAAAVIGIVFVGQSSGWFVLGTAFTILAGVLALFVRRGRRIVD